MHPNVISANKHGGVVHHNESVSDSGAADFHGNGTQSLRNLQHDGSRVTIFESYLKGSPEGIS